MVQTESLTFTLMAEALLAFSLIAVVMLVMNFKRKGRERKAVTELIEKLSKSGSDRSSELKQALSENGNLDDIAMDSIMEEIRVSEKQLFQQVISMFINRDAGLLGDLHHRVHAITNPYLTLLKNETVVAKVTRELESAEINEDHASEAAASGATNPLNNAITTLKHQNEKLSEQLNLALETMDEVSNEYTKMFSDVKNQEELEQSKKRMLAVFERASIQSTSLYKTKSPDHTPTEQTDTTSDNIEEKIPVNEAEAPTQKKPEQLATETPTEEITEPHNELASVDDEVTKNAEKLIDELEETAEDTQEAETDSKDQQEITAEAEENKAKEETARQAS